MRKKIIIMSLLTFVFCAFADSADLQKGMSYLEKKDYKNAEKYLKTAYENGDKDAPLQLGILYYETKQKDLLEKYLKIGSDNGDALASYVLGNYYDDIKNTGN